MARPKKYERGAPITNGSDLFDELAAGRWVWVRHKAYHPGFVASQSVRYLMDCVAKGWAFRTVGAGEPTPIGRWDVGLEALARELGCFKCPKCATWNGPSACDCVNCKAFLDRDAEGGSHVDP